MAGYNKPWMRREPLQKTRVCECGGEAKLGSRTNYPFGRKSKGILTMGYTCRSCRKLTILNKMQGGRR
ncbi:MAG: hypothetical protein ABIH92_03585 [Nanoarchaeota archaeon]